MIDRSSSDGGEVVGAIEDGDNDTGQVVLGDPTIGQLGDQRFQPIIELDRRSHAQR
ncbi:MAG: hypothetical protein R2710_11630 [Acidimicrobiales bacterium]